MHDEPITAEPETPSTPRWVWTLGAWLALPLSVWAVLPSLGGPTFERVVHQSVAIGVAVLLAERAVRQGDAVGFFVGGVTLVFLVCVFATLVVSVFL